MKFINEHTNQQEDGFKMGIDQYGTFELVQEHDSEIRFMLRGESMSDPVEERMRIMNNGNVGIGTDSPEHKLVVSGTIGACRVIVEEENWCDYVFADDYKLMSLYELEQYINTNKHLPSIPSAEEVAEEGIDLGDMQKLMMEKIEELTLYIIEQEKRIQELETQLNNE